MNRDKILNMPAGTGLDLLIAYRVMHTENKTGKQIGFRAEGYEDSTFWNIDGHWDVTPPPFSTDHAAAFQVWEKFREPGKPEPDYWTLIDGGDTWIITSNWAHHDGDIENFRVEAESFPLAVCRAALLATMKHE